MQRVPPALPRSKVRLVHVPADWQAPWQWQTLAPWTDEVTEQPTAYVCGFKTEAAARVYGRQTWGVG